MLASDHANRLARTLARSISTQDESGCVSHSRCCPSDVRRRDALHTRDADGGGVRVVRSSASLTSLESVVDVAAPTLAATATAVSAVDRLAAQALAGSAEARSTETLGNSGEMLARGGGHSRRDTRPKGVVVATAYLTGDLAARLVAALTQAFESYNQLAVVLKRPLTGLYLSFFS